MSLRVYPRIARPEKETKQLYGFILHYLFIIEYLLEAVTVKRQRRIKKHIMYCNVKKKHFQSVITKTPPPFFWQYHTYNFLCTLKCQSATSILVMFKHFSRHKNLADILLTSTTFSLQALGTGNHLTRTLLILARQKMHSTLLLRHKTFITTY